MDYEIRIPKSVLHWFENGELVKNPEFSNNMEVYRVGINENYEDIQDIQAQLGIYSAITDQNSDDIEIMQDQIDTLLGLTAEIPNKTSDLINDSGFVNSTEVGTIVDTDVNSKIPSIVAQVLTQITIPTKTSDLINDSGFITSSALPTKTSDLTNDSGFITSADVPTKTSDLTNDSGFITASAIPTNPATIGANVSVTDVGGYFTGTDVEGILQEIGAELAGVVAAVQAQSGVVA